MASLSFKQLVAKEMKSKGNKKGGKFRFKFRIAKPRNAYRGVKKKPLSSGKRNKKTKKTNKKYAKKANKLTSSGKKSVKTKKGRVSISAAKKNIKGVSPRSVKRKKIPHSKPRVGTSRALVPYKSSSPFSRGSQSPGGWANSKSLTSNRSIYPNLSSNKAYSPGGWKMPKGPGVGRRGVPSGSPFTKPMIQSRLPFRMPWRRSPKVKTPKTVSKTGKDQLSFKKQLGLKATEGLMSGIGQGALMGTFGLGSTYLAHKLNQNSAANGGVSAMEEEFVPEKKKPTAADRRTTIAAKALQTLSATNGQSRNIHNIRARDAIHPMALWLARKYKERDEYYNPHGRLARLVKNQAFGSGKKKKNKKGRKGKKGKTKKTKGKKGKGKKKGKKGKKGKKKGKKKSKPLKQANFRSMDLTNEQRKWLNQRDIFKRM